ncbi:hypothetical protein EIP86_000253 [Pleurotus ostreatoroseus]|nr:hypothetical protein EIP86_000253 [Pleurotus ostreatoroseus]
MATSSRPEPGSDRREYLSQVDANPAHSSPLPNSQVDGAMSGPSESLLPSMTVPPSTSSVPSSVSYPRDGSLGLGTTRADSLPGATASSPTRAALPTRPPDWLRENSSVRHTASTSRATSNSRVPPPARPAVLAPPPISSNNAQEVHRRFLSQAPPPQDSYLAVETSMEAYVLIAHLPGFRRESMTLSTRRRRILHIVADSWEPNGGHFERRISFGYDANLTQVRAEFDGQMLRITVPRRVSPVTYWSGRI